MLTTHEQWQLAIWMVMVDRKLFFLPLMMIRKVTIFMNGMVWLAVIITELLMHLSAKLKLISVVLEMELAQLLTEHPLGVTMTV